MVVYTLEKCWEILHYFETHGNIAELCTDFGRREAPSAPYTRYLVKKVKETGVFTESEKQCVEPRILLLWQKVCVKRHQHQFTVLLASEHFGDIIETNFA